MIAQSVEHAAVNRGVVGSSPTQGAKILYLNIMARWLSWLERRPVTAEVDGSNPFRVVSLWAFIMDGFPSGQRGQTVNLLSLTSVVRIHLHPLRR